jgi:hypothetical protein
LKSGFRFCMNAVTASMFSGEPASARMPAFSAASAASMPARCATWSVRLMPTSAEIGHCAI